MTWSEELEYKNLHLPYVMYFRTWISDSSDENGSATDFWDEVKVEEGDMEW